MNRFIKRGVSLMVMLMFLGMTSAAMAGVVALHTGPADPISEGWSQHGFGNSGLFEGTTGDAWFIDDKSNAFGSSKQYLYNLTEDEQAAADNGWILTTRLNVRTGKEIPPPMVDENLTAYKRIDMAVMIEYINDTTAFRMDFGLDDNNNPVVLLQDGWIGNESTGISYTVPTAGYHTYSLVFKNDAASLFVDDEEVLSGYTGRPESKYQNRVAWGAFFDSSLGGADYQMVSLEVAPPAPVPVPGSVFLLAGGLVSALVIRKMFAK